MSTFLGDFGTSDLAIYWAAMQVLLSGGNPYDLNQMTEQLASLGRAPLLVWNPPWIFFLLFPFLSPKSFSLAQLVLLISNLALIGVLLLYCRKIVGVVSGRAGAAVMLFTVFLCYPVFVSLKLGQISLLLTAAVFSAVWCFENKRDALCGLSLVVLTLKPHVAFLVTGFIVFRAIAERRTAVVVFGAFFLLCVLLGTHFVFPELFKMWFETSRVPSEWLGSTFSSWLRPMLLLTYSGKLIVSLAISLVSLAVVARIAFVRRETSLRDILPTLICASCFFAPYGFLFDQAPLMLVVYEMLFRVQREFSTKGFLVFLIVATAALLNPLWLPYREFGILFPVIVWALWYASRKKLVQTISP